MLPRSTKRRKKRRLSGFVNLALPKSRPRRNPRPRRPIRKAGLGQSSARLATTQSLPELLTRITGGWSCAIPAGAYSTKTPQRRTRKLSAGKPAKADERNERGQAGAGFIVNSFVLQILVCRECWGTNHATMQHIKDGAERISPVAVMPDDADGLPPKAILRRRGEAMGETRHSQLPSIRFPEHRLQGLMRAAIRREYPKCHLTPEEIAERL